MIRGLSWDLYERLSDAIGEGQHVRLAFDGSNLEIMTTGPLHEEVKDLPARLVNTVTIELDIPCKGAGETTWKRPELTRRLAADQCFRPFQSTNSARKPRSGIRPARKVTSE